MSPFIGLHSTVRRYRTSIRELGLLAGIPAKGRPYGVYIFNENESHATFSRGSACRWGWHPPMDLWRVAYIGRIKPDHYVENGFILLDPIPPQHLELITHITPDSYV